MIVTGDVAIAHEDVFIFKDIEHLQEKNWIINLEGFITKESNYSKESCVYNSNKWYDSFKSINVNAAFLGNNHIQDIENGIQQSISKLDEQNISFFGAGLNEEQRKLYYEINENDLNYKFIGFGWPVIGCKLGSSSSPGVNKFDYKNVITQAKAILDKSANTRVVVVIHGNYEFELYPQPGHRALARELIDLGVYSVLFHHPHIVGPIERYKEKTIAYSLGNWAFSYGKFFDGKLRFPSKSFPQIAIEFSKNEDIVHHASFCPPSTVNFLSSELVHANDFSLKAVFEGFSDSDYLLWFKKNRLKRKALPVYKTTHRSLENKVKDLWVWFRQILIDTILKVGLRSLDRN